MSKSPQIRLLLADVDGTLVTKEKVLTEQAAAAVRDMEAEGILFAMTSGRPPRGMATLIDDLKITTPVAGFNGGVMINPDFSVLDTLLLPYDAAKTALATILEMGLDAWVYTPGLWLCRDPQAPHAPREARTVGFAATVVPEFTDEHLAQAAKIVGVGDDFDLVARCEAAVQQALGNNASAARSQPYYLDVTNREANKGAVVDRLSEMLNIPRENIATIGDMPNDTVMFARSGLSIAMGNASDAVKALAHKVTDSHEDEGFAKAVRNFILA